MKIALVGDVMLGRLVNDSLKHTPPTQPWGNTIDLLQQADLRICNLECVLSDIGRPWSMTEKIFHFRSDEKNVESLLAAGINMVSLANNHVLDYEYDALLRMLDVLNAHGITYAGAGKNISEAAKPALYRSKGYTIGMIAFTDNEPTWEASSDKPGVYYVPTIVKDPRAQKLFQTIRELRKEVDLLIISAHWGSNWGYEPPHAHPPFAHALIEAGADLIFGHSAHVFRGVEIYKQRPIIYSAGDFIDDYAVDEIERNDESFLFLLEWEREHNRILHFYPAFNHSMQTDLANAPLSGAILSKMDRLCQTLGTPITRYPDHASVSIH